MRQAIGMQRGSPKGLKRNLTTRAMLVRPYTVRKGDTVFKISQKRGMTVDEVLSLNHGLRKKFIEEGQTILLPSSRLSSRDKEILDGVKSKGYRAYPVRKGETIEDITSKRGIRMGAVERLNEGVDLGSLRANQVIKLPKGKYTEREKEMMTGVCSIPHHFFSATKKLTLTKPFLLVVVVAVAAAAAYKSQQNEA